MKTEISGSASISECGRYRYRLDRFFGGPGAKVAVVGIRPRTLHGLLDDHFVEREMVFARKCGWSQFTEVNLFACQTDWIPRLRTVDDPIGPENDSHIEQVFNESGLLVCAWGSPGKLSVHLRTRWRAMVRLAKGAGKNFYSFGNDEAGHPKHILMIHHPNKLIRWTPPQA